MISAGFILQNGCTLKERRNLLAKDRSYIKIQNALNCGRRSFLRGEIPPPQIFFTSLTFGRIIDIPVKYFSGARSGLQATG